MHKIVPDAKQLRFFSRLSRKSKRSYSLMNRFVTRAIVRIPEKRIARTAMCAGVACQLHISIQSRVSLSLSRVSNDPFSLSDWPKCLRALFRSLPLDRIDTTTMSWRADVDGTASFCHRAFIYRRFYFRLHWHFSSCRHRTYRNVSCFLVATGARSIPILSRVYKDETRDTEIIIYIEVKPNLSVAKDCCCHLGI